MPRASAAAAAAAFQVRCGIIVPWSRIAPWSISVSLHSPPSRVGSWCHDSCRNRRWRWKAEHPCRSPGPWRLSLTDHEGAPFANTRLWATRIWCSSVSRIVLIFARHARTAAQMNREQSAGLTHVRYRRSPAGRPDRDEALCGCFGGRLIGLRGDDAALVHFDQSRSGQLRSQQSDGASSWITLRRSTSSIRKAAGGRVNPVLAAGTARGSGCARGAKLSSERTSCRRFSWCSTSAQHLIPRGDGRPRIRYAPVKNALISAFMKGFTPDLSMPRTGSSLVREFQRVFTRALRPGARPIATASTRL